jgi:hypothetical protein
MNKITTETWNGTEWVEYCQKNHKKKEYLEILSL